jgi:uncharacterized protein (TIGR04222 family)
MNASSHPLWQRLQAYDFGGAAEREAFLAKLAREQGWSLGYAERVLAEYLRYVFLCCSDNGPMCPSEQVDQAWHLHLTYSREYWNNFCPRVLQQQLHHTPSAGANELVKHQAMCQETLAAYRKWFGAMPAIDVWPNVDERFGLPTESYTPTKNELPTFARKATWLGLTLLGALGWGAMMQYLAVGDWKFLLDLRGQEFLVFYLFCLVPAVVWAILIRCTWTPPHVVYGEQAVTLGGYEAAYLNDAERGVTHAAIAALTGCKILEYDKKLQITPQAAQELSNQSSSPLLAPWRDDLIALTILQQASQGVLLKTIVKAVKPLTVAIREQLTGLGLLMTRQQQRLSYRVAATPLFLLFIVGAAKFGVGLSRDKSVGFLGALLVVSVIAWVMVRFAAPSVPRSNRGSAAYNRLQALNGLLKLTAYQSAQPEYATLLLAFGLFGVTALNASPHDAMKRYLAMPGSGSGCGGGSGCSGGDGGGGGGCGGGCGGCGGGD